jgi:hypothetical protein
MLGGVRGHHGRPGQRLLVAVSCGRYGQSGKENPNSSGMLLLVNFGHVPQPRYACTGLFSCVACIMTLFLVVPAPAFVEIVADTERGAFPPVGIYHVHAGRNT